MSRPLHPTPPSASVRARQSAASVTEAARSEANRKLIEEADYSDAVSGVIEDIERAREELRIASR